MIRKAFLMEVQPGKAADYERTHNPIWPELEAIFKRQGVHNYSIFIHEPTNQLFGYVEIEDEARWNAIAGEAVCQKWWRYMTNFLVSRRPGDAKAKEDELRQVFHLD
jgi:L-rhamnose mutarotase